jgi:hypothetical protein
MLVAPPMGRTMIPSSSRSTARLIARVSNATWSLAPSTSTTISGLGPSASAARARASSEAPARGLNSFMDTSVAVADPR